MALEIEDKYQFCFGVDEQEVRENVAKFTAALDEEAAKTGLIECRQITQHYVALNKSVETRVRRALVQSTGEIEYTLTTKAKFGKDRVEHEMVITQEEYETYAMNSIGFVNKFRYSVKAVVCENWWQRLKRRMSGRDLFWEIDVYPFEHIVTAEVEFHPEEGRRYVYPYRGDAMYYVKRIIDSEQIPTNRDIALRNGSV